MQTANAYTQEKTGDIYDELLYVSVKAQKMYHILNAEIIKTYTISTAEKGVGNIKNSDQTPLGLHSIKEKHGENTPINGRMVGRIFYGKITAIYQDSTRSKTDDVTTRILWLTGEEEGFNKGENVDSYLRANKEDKKSWELNNLKMPVLLPILKPLRKVHQFFTKP